MLIFDAHLDLSMNALEWNRDLTRPLAEVRQREAGRTDKVDRGQGTVSLPEMRRGQVGLCVATMIARYVKSATPLPGWHSPEIAWAQTQGQLAWYRAMEEAGEMVQITDVKSLDRHIALWQDRPTHRAPVGYVLSLEGAGFDPYAGPTRAFVRRGSKGRGSGPLWAGHVCLWHAFVGRHRRRRP